MFLLTPGAKTWLYGLLALIALMAVLLFMGLEAKLLLRYSREFILEGQLWRLLTAHLVHVNPVHGVMNMGALVIIVLFVGDQLSALCWGVATLCIALTISLALLAFSPEVVWYVGFSGVLHGLLALGLVLGSKAGDKWHMLALLLLLVKLVREQLPGFDIHQLQGLIEAPVVVDAHMYGAIAGLLLAFILLLVRHLRMDNMQNISDSGH